MFPVINSSLDVYITASLQWSLRIGAMAPGDSSRGLWLGRCGGPWRRARRGPRERVGVSSAGTGACTRREVTQGNC